MRPTLPAVLAAAMALHGCQTIDSILASTPVASTSQAAGMPPEDTTSRRERNARCAPDRGSIKTAPGGDGRARRAARRGLTYLTKASKAWTEKHRCFGCHVQAVTMEALTVGMRNQYDVAAADVDAMAAALQMGVTAGGRVTGAAFEGQAWAGYDQFVDAKRTDELLKYAAELVGYQSRDGSIPDDDARLPITGGTMHTTYQAMQTWRQAYARTADDKWLPPMRLAEEYLAGHAKGWGAGKDVYVQNINYALLGLVAAGVGPTEASSRRLQELLMSRQNEDGGWSLSGDKSDALATGQTLYALKQAGFTESDRRIARGLEYLVAKQDKGGGWYTLGGEHVGLDKGEGMWAVLGLVSVDVMSLSVAGVRDGQHVDGKLKLDVNAKLNDGRGAGITQLDLLLDDKLIASECGERLEHTLGADSLPEGKHLLDVVATDGRGRTSRRRMRVYAGDIYLTDMAARFDEQKAAVLVTARNIASTPQQAGQVSLTVYSVVGDDKRGPAVFHEAYDRGAQGPLAFSWAGKNSKGDVVPSGRYWAELALRQGDRVVQRQELLVSNESEAQQRQKWAEIEGSLAMEGSVGVAANSEVELVDDKGRVVQRTRSTAQGNYRFKHVKKGNYKVRARKRGWRSLESAVEAEPAAAPARADMHFN